MGIHVVKQLVVVCAIFPIFFRTASGISCYQCLSRDHVNPFQCTEFMEDADIQPTPCDAIFGSQYCVKHTGRFEGGLGTKRFCSPLDLGNYCNYIKQPGDELEYRSCVYTCSGDGCNSTTMKTPFGISALLLIGLIVIFISKRVNIL